jgi:hypothetical protein
MPTVLEAKGFSGSIVRPPNVLGGSTVRPPCATSSCHTSKALPFTPLHRKRPRTTPREPFLGASRRTTRTLSSQCNATEGLRRSPSLSLEEYSAEGACAPNTHPLESSSPAIVARVSPIRSWPLGSAGVHRRSWLKGLSRGREQAIMKAVSAAQPPLSIARAQRWHPKGCSVRPFRSGRLACWASWCLWTHGSLRCVTGLAGAA